MITQINIKQIARVVLTESTYFLAKLSYSLIAGIISLISLIIMLLPTIALLKHVRLPKDVHLGHVYFIGTCFFIGTIIIGTYLLHAIFKDLADLMFERKTE